MAELDLKDVSAAQYTLESDIPFVDSHLGGVTVSLQHLQIILKAWQGVDGISTVLFPEQLHYSFRRNARIYVEDCFRIGELVSDRTTVLFVAIPDPSYTYALCVDDPVLINQLPDSTPVIALVSRGAVVEVQMPEQCPLPLDDVSVIQEVSQGNFQLGQSFQGREYSRRESPIYRRAYFTELFMGAIARKDAHSVFSKLVSAFTPERIYLGGDKYQSSDILSAIMWDLDLVGKSREADVIFREYAGTPRESIPRGLRSTANITDQLGTAAALIYILTSDLDSEIHLDIFPETTKNSVLLGLNRIGGRGIRRVVAEDVEMGLVYPSVNPILVDVFQTEANRQAYYMKVRSVWMFESEEDRIALGHLLNIVRFSPKPTRLTTLRRIACPIPLAELTLRGVVNELREVTRELEISWKTDKLGSERLRMVGNFIAAYDLHGAQTDLLIGGYHRVLSSRQVAEKLGVNVTAVSAFFTVVDKILILKQNPRVAFSHRGRIEVERKPGEKVQVARRLLELVELDPRILLLLPPGFYRLIEMARIIQSHNLPGNRSSKVLSNAAYECGFTVSTLNRYIRSMDFATSIVERIHGGPRSTEDEDRYKMLLEGLVYQGLYERFWTPEGSL